jgi:hypothetical protein
VADRRTQNAVGSSWAGNCQVLGNCKVLGGQVLGDCEVKFPRMAAKSLNAWPTHLDIRINTSTVNKYIDGESIGKTSFGEVAHQKWSGR